MSGETKHRVSAIEGFETEETSSRSGIMSPPTAWEDLPPQLLEKVMALLPVHVVCRARTVCKTWNQVLSQPESAATRSLAPRQASDSILIAPKRSLYRYPTMEWEVLDVAERKTVLDVAEREVLHVTKNHLKNQPLGHSYILRDAFSVEFFGPNSESSSLLRYTLAADRELVYTILEKPTTGSRVHLVCNPVRKSVHEIPELKYSFDHDIVVMMSVQSAASAYKIIVMGSYARVNPSSELVHLYDSTTSAWTTLCKLPNKDYYAYSSIFMNGVLYTLFVDTSTEHEPWRRMLFTCDLATGAWTSIDVRSLPIPFHPQDKAQLVVSSGRLFLVEYTGLPLTPLFSRSSWEMGFAFFRETTLRHSVHVSIFEIQLAAKKSVCLEYRKKIAQYPREMLDFKELVVAVGCTDSIVIISCLLGRRVAFDLSKYRWFELRLPRHLPFPNGNASRGVFAGIVDF